MESLQNTLEKVTRDNKRAKKLRRYIVVEAVYQVIFIILLTVIYFVPEVLYEDGTNLMQLYFLVKFPFPCLFPLSCILIYIFSKADIIP